MSNTVFSYIKVEQNKESLKNYYILKEAKETRKVSAIHDLGLDCGLCGENAIKNTLQVKTGIWIVYEIKV